MAQLHAGIWLATALYVLAAASAAWAGMSSAHDPDSSRERRFWLAVAIILILLALFRLIDLQAVVSSWGRGVARQQGWYEQHRVAQAAFILILVVLGGLVLRKVFKHAQGISRPAQIAVTLVALLTGYVLVRATSFHPFDRLVGRPVLGVPLNWILEAGCIVAVLAVSVWGRRLAASR